MNSFTVLMLFNVRGLNITNGRGEAGQTYLQPEEW